MSRDFQRPGSPAENNCISNKNGDATESVVVNIWKHSLGFLTCDFYHVGHLMFFTIKISGRASSCIWMSQLCSSAEGNVFWSMKQGMKRLSQRRRKRNSFLKSAWTIPSTAACWLQSDLCQGAPFISDVFHSLPLHRKLLLKKKIIFGETVQVLFTGSKGSQTYIGAMNSAEDVLYLETRCSWWTLSEASFSTEMKPVFNDLQRC